MDDANTFRYEKIPALPPGFSSYTYLADK